MAWKQITFTATQAQAEQISDMLHGLGALSITLQEGGEDKIYEPLPGETPLWQHTKVVGLFEQDVEISSLLQVIKQLLHVDELPHYEIQLIDEEVRQRAAIA